ncbi:nicotinamide-nucleotide amidase [Edwardsiella tarda]
MSELATLSREVGERLRARGEQVTCAESCTGGWIAKSLTDIAGSSCYFERGFVTYSNRAKAEMLGVASEVLAQHGAVSEPVVAAMATGALRAAGADFAIAVSGIAGPDGGSEQKPVGTVWFSFATRNAPPWCCCRHFLGDRDAVRRQATEFALRTLLEKFLTES